MRFCRISIVFIFATLLAYSSWSNAPVWHEPAQLLTGLNIWKFGRFDTQTVNPPLVRAIASLPVLALSPNHDKSKFDRPPTGRDEFHLSSVFLEENSSKARLLFFVGRLACLVFAIVGVFFCYRFAKELFGAVSGIIVLLVVCFSPFILGHGATIMNDVPTAFMAVIALYFFWKWLKRPEMLEVIIAGIILGLAVLTKFTLLIFYPFFFILWLLYRLPDYQSLKFKEIARQLGSLCIIYIVSMFVINCGYIGNGTFTSLDSFRFKSLALTGKTDLEAIPYDGANRFEGTLLGKLPVPLPKDMVQGIDLQKLDFERGLPSYLRGEWSDHGWWYYYLYALLIKTPLGTLGLLLLAIYCTFFTKECNASWRDEMVILLPGIALLVFVSFQTGFSVHSRYVIPALPFFFIWISKVGRAISWKRPALSTIVVTLLLWSVAGSLWVYPHSISYFNGLAAVLPTPKDADYPKPPETPKGLKDRARKLLDAGSLNGPRHLLDSNIDWGQDLFYLEQWCRANPDVTELKVAYSGSYPLESTKIPSVAMPPANVPQPGWYALSVNYLYDREKQYRYFLNFEPVARAGYSIYIYHLTQEDVERLRNHSIE